MLAGFINCCCIFYVIGVIFFIIISIKSEKEHPCVSRRLRRFKESANVVFSIIWPISLLIMYWLKEERKNNEK